MNELDVVISMPPADEVDTGGRGGVSDDDGGRGGDRFAAVPAVNEDEMGADGEDGKEARAVAELGKSSRRGESAERGEGGDIGDIALRRRAPERPTAREMSLFAAA